METADAYILYVLFLCFLWFIPFLSILFSRRTRGSEKIGWLLAVIFISWMAWIIYLIIAPIKKSTRNSNEQLEWMNSLQKKDKYPVNTNIYQNPANTSIPGKGNTQVTTKPNLQDWLKSNPGKSIHDYFLEFGS